ncbi:MAG TPA: hypothetical protein VFS43_03340 [Polyangiaceae bacterium]|nr:hypothetical protein [Polyangiaceae bacterium]
MQFASGQLCRWSLRSNGIEVKAQASLKAGHATLDRSRMHLELDWGVKGEVEVQVAPGLRPKLPVRGSIQANAESK